MYLGLESSSTSLNVAAVDDDGAVEFATAVERSTLREGSLSMLEFLDERVALDGVEMAAMAFAWGDALDAVRPADVVPNRGNRGTPGFLRKTVDARVFDELAGSDLPCVAVPGVNDRLECLHPYFRHYAQLSGPDKVADARHALRVARAAGHDGETFVSANASSSTRAVVVVDGHLRGAFHWLGLVHGWPDGDVFEAILRGEVDPRTAVQRAGLLYKPGAGHAEWPSPDGPAPDSDADGTARQRAMREDLVAAADDEVLLELVHWATLHAVHSLVPFAQFDGDHPLEHVVVSGRLARVESPYDVRGELRTALSTVAPTTITEPYSAATGAALVARDVSEGADDVLGIPVEV